MIAVVIVACEVGFWLVLALGLSFRYPLRRPRVGGALLAGVPLVDVVLLVATAIDLARGAEFHQVHALAALYLGFSVAFGPSLVRWADVRFAHRFAGGPPPPPKPPKPSRARQAALWAEWRRVVGAAAIASVVLGLLALVVDADQRSAVLAGAGPLWVVVVAWLVLGPLWEAGSNRAASPRSG